MPRMFATFAPDMGALLALGYVALLLWWIRRSRFFALPGLRKRHLAGLFLLKVAAGTALWLIYTHHYTERANADIFKYFDDSATMYAALWERPVDFFRMLFGIGNDTPYFTEAYYRHMDHWFRKYESNLYNDAHTMIRFNAVVRILSGGHIHVHNVFAAFLAFTGMTALCRAFVRHLPGRERALYASVFLVPSVLFWASGVIKESLLFFGLGLMLWKSFRWIEGRFSARDLVVLAFCLVLLFFLKFYVLLSMLPALAALIWCRRAPARPLVKYAITMALFTAAGANMQHLIKGFDIIDILWWKHQDFIGLATAMNSGSYVAPPPLSPDLLGFLFYAPYAVYMALLGPLVHGGGGALSWISAIENATIVLAAALCLFHMRRPIAIDRPLLLFCITYILLLAFVIGVTTPVMGAVVRYRTPMLPFLLIAALLVLDERRLVARFPKLKILFA